MPARAETEPNVIPARAIAPPAGFAVAETQPLVLTLGIYAVTFLVPAWPWLTGTVTIPWDAESQFRPQLAFLPRSRPVSRRSGPPTSLRAGRRSAIRNR